MTMEVSLELSEIAGGLQVWTVMANERQLARFEFHRTEGTVSTPDGKKIEGSQTFIVEKE